MSECPICGSEFEPTNFIIGSVFYCDEPCWNKGRAKAMVDNCRRSGMSDEGLTQYAKSLSVDLDFPAGSPVLEKGK